MDHPSADPSPALAISDDLQDAARTFFPDLTEIAAVPGHPDIVRVSAPSGHWRVHRWAEGIPESDVAFSHEVTALARASGVTGVPGPYVPTRTPPGQTLRLGQRLFDAQGWLPGEPPARADVAWPNDANRIDLPVVLAPTVFAEVIANLARLHEATTALAATPGIPLAPLHLLPGAVQQAQGRHVSALRARARHEPAIQRWISTGERLLALAGPIVLEATGDQDQPTSVLHLGLWPAHILLDNGGLSGLLGWERVAAGSPLLDIAQATLRLQGWNDDAVELALGTYADARHLSPDERRLIPAVAALDAVATTGRMLEQTYANAETARPPSALRAAIDMMLRSMTDLDRNLGAPSEKSRRRTWNRQRPAPGSQKGGKPRERPRRGARPAS